MSRIFKYSGILEFEHKVVGFADQWPEFRPRPSADLGGNNKVNFADSSMLAGNQPAFNTRP